MAESQLGEAFICEDSKGELVQELLKYGIYGEETTLELRHSCRSQEKFRRN